MQEEKNFIDFNDLIIPIWRRKLLILLCVIIGFGGAVWKLHNTTRAYTVSVEIQAIQVAEDFNLNFANSGTASLSRGVPRSRSDILSIDRFEDIMFSREIAQQFISKHPEVIKEIYSSEWNELQNIYNEPALSNFETLKKYLMFLVTGKAPQKYIPPNSLRLSLYLQSFINSNIDLNKNRLQLFIQTSDTDLSSNILTNLIQLTQDYVFESEVKRSKNIIDRLSNQLKNNRLSAEADILRSMILNEKTKLSMLKVSNDVGFEILYGPEVSLVPTYPNEKKTLILGVLIGLLFGILNAYSLYFFLGRDKK